MNFAEHCARTQDQPVSHLLFWVPHTERTSRGRPLKTFSQNLKEDTNINDCKEIIELMKNKTAWKDLTKRAFNVFIISLLTGDK